MNEAREAGGAGTPGAASLNRWAQELGPGDGSLGGAATGRGVVEGSAFELECPGRVPWLSRHCRGLWGDSK